VTVGGPESRAQVAWEVFAAGATRQCHIFMGSLEPPFTPEPASAMLTCVKHNETTSL
jgi:hypothetical protein